MREAMTDAVAMLALAPLAGLAADIGLHMILVRIYRGGAHVRVQFIAFAFGMAITFVTLANLLWQYPFAPSDRLGYLLLHAIIYSCFGFGLFNVINANVSSLRLRMLKEYLLHDPAPLPDAVMYQRYPARAILAVRLARLESGRQIVSREGRYYTRGGSVVLIGRFFAALRWLLLRK